MCWGSNYSGQVGSSVACPYTCNTPTEVEGIDATVSVEANAFNSCATVLNGTLKCWGNNLWGQVGNGLSGLSHANAVDVHVDTDRDGCPDASELSNAPSSGGVRNPKSFWDFFSVPTGLGPGRDRRITIGDVVAVVRRFGLSGSPLMDPLSEPPPTPPFPQFYHTAFDRTLVGPNVWNLGPPNGSITILDIALVVGQFGHTCA
jgi:hypothetical protein